MRRAPQEGQKPRFLQLKATSFSAWHCSQRRRRKPSSSRPHFRCSVFIAGFLDRLDGNLPQWNPSGVSLTRVDATHWSITLTGKEGTQLEYKYTNDSWNFVEKDATCAEIANRQLTVSYGATGTQLVNDSIANWRNVAPCGA